MQSKEGFTLFSPFSYLSNDSFISPNDTTESPNVFAHYLFAWKKYCLQDSSILHPHSVYVKLHQIL